MRFAIALLVAVVASACSINHRSDAFACESDTDCTEPGRICAGNVCVLAASDAGRDAPRDDAPPSDGRLPDAGDPLPDAPPSGCPDTCTSCETGDDGVRTCIVDCDENPARCGAQINCPPGLACDVRCTRPGSCREGVRCDPTLPCAVSCTGDNSCEDIRCGAGTCFVDCAAAGSCEDVRCGASCACDVDCAFDASCAEIDCTGQNSCDALDGGCNSQRFGCDTCE